MINVVSINSFNFKFIMQLYIKLKNINVVYIIWRLLNLALAIFILMHMFFRHLLIKSLFY